MLSRQAPKANRVLSTVARNPDFAWHVTASWRDVQAKAKRIRAEGGVHIVIASNDGIGGQVKGDHAVYETILVYRPGTKQISDYGCGCKWASYAWGRSPAFRRFQGRKCSHALALQYEAQSRGMFGKEVRPQGRPGWLTQRTPVVTEYDKDTGRNVQARPFEGALLPALVTHLRGEDADPANVIGTLMRAGLSHKAAVRLWKTAYPNKDVGALLPVKQAGYKGYVDAYEGNHDEMEEMDRRLDGPHHDFDEDLWDETTPEAHPHEQAHYEEHGEYPDSYYERRDEAYAKAKQQKEESVRPIGHHTPLYNFLLSHDSDHEFWNKHARLEDVDHGKQMVYATQPYVTRRHLDRYIHNRDDTVQHVRQYGETETSRNYPGTYHPMMVRHEGNLFAIEGHHRTASDILSGHKTRALVYDADKHGWPEPEDSAYEVDRPGLVKYAMKLADCDYQISDPKEAAKHALRHHDEGICTATERRRARERRRAKHHEEEHRCPHCDGLIGVEAMQHGHCPHCDAPLGSEHHQAARGSQTDREREKDEEQKRRHRQLERGLGGTHNPRHCPICRAGHEGIVKRAAPVPPPFPNPAGGREWYHGTDFDPHEDHEREDDPEEYDSQHGPGGQLRTPDRDSDEIGALAHKHWNTDLGIHFSSLGEVAHDFATRRGWRQTANSRIAHTTLHMKNPIQFPDEESFGRHAIDWARSKGHRFLPGDKNDRESLHEGNYNEVDDPKYNYLREHMSRGVPTSIGTIDDEGPQDHHKLHHTDDWLTTHPERKQITEGYRHHLLRLGHDGVVYGNSMEGPRHHPCAIAFPETPIHIRRWEWFDNDAVRKHNPEHVEIDPRQQALFHVFHYAKKQDTPSVSGIALKADDTGRILMIQRDHSDEKDPARGRWEIPGGHHEDGDLTSLHAGVREWQEEVGQPFPEGGVVQHTWTSPDGVYQGHVVVIPSESDLSMKDGRVVPNPDDPKGDRHEQAAWWEIEHAQKNPALREEMKQGTPWKELEKASLGTEKTASRALDWHDVQRKYPHVYGDEAKSGEEEDNFAGWDPAGAVASLAFDRPEKPSTELENPGHSDETVHDLTFHETRVHPQNIDYIEHAPDDLRVLHAVDGYRTNPEAMPPVLLVHRHGVYQVADGHHRADAGHRAGVPIPALVAHSPYPDVPFASGERASLHKEAAAWDPISNVNPQPGRGISEPLHSNSTNPASTGWATSEDPADWSNLDTDPGRMTPTLGYDAVLHQHVEPALPSTDGDLDPVPDNPLKPDDLVSEQDSDIGLLDGSAMPNMFHASLPENARVAAIVQRFQQTEAAQALMVGQSEDAENIAAAAQAHLRKTALAEFSHEEQQELINENPRGRARNFAELDLDGTHYALLQAALDAEGDDATVLFL